MRIGERLPDFYTLTQDRERFAKEIGSYSPERIQDLMQKIVEPNKRDLWRDIDNNPEVYKAFLTKLMDDMTAARGASGREFVRTNSAVPSVRSLCANFIIKWQMRMLESVLDLDPPPRPTDFIYGLDLYFGGIASITPLTQAIFAIDEGLLGRGNFIRDSVERLKADPTGFQLLAYTVTRLRGRNPIVLPPPHTIHEYVVAGAELTEGAYQRAYPLAELVLSFGEPS
ncbi:hypothetical protein A3F00_04245 [Candidatus Daviesbacteria bacterium RIFCSPHIGHO2_12_FULL_37_11]|uniref:Uncharacterized protein n=1 Tax=Candidatus Daviesbacteria bacterium RIFCSPHIGHO2_12_FULL_37_11 TaxID=1797777 RepID=A0A1F5KE95_9BACT|nr:MAG: hypothetical protein A3F00_04245 [Candidatus Daviesbacteria bacterium RIFCSPHIGHO2_12_FULL_37_11]